MASKSSEASLNWLCVFSRHQAGWFPFRPEQQNLRGGERARAPQEDAERHQDFQEMVSGDAWGVCVCVCSLQSEGVITELTLGVQFLSSSRTPETRKRLTATFMCEAESEA